MNPEKYIAPMYIFITILFMCCFYWLFNKKYESKMINLSLSSWCLFSSIFAGAIGFYSVKGGSEEIMVIVSSLFTLCASCSFLYMSK